jgi:hypothetical protein
MCITECGCTDPRLGGNTPEKTPRTFNSEADCVLECGDNPAAPGCKRPSVEERPCRTPRVRERSSRISPRVVKASDAAVYLCVSKWKLRRLVQDGLLPAIIGDGTAPWLFDVRDLDSYIDAAKARL